MNLENLEDLFQSTLQDIYYAEKKLVKTLPGMAKKAASPELREAIENHLQETEGHVTRLERVFAALDKTPKAKKCEAMEGLLKEASEFTGDMGKGPTLDAALIASAQTVEHYEIARYGTLSAWAGEMGRDEIVAILDETLDEEKAADDKLSSLAEASINQQAA